MNRGIGLELSQHFYEAPVAPTFKKYFPGYSHMACRIGLGSEVLGHCHSEDVLVNFLARL